MSLVTRHLSLSFADFFLDPLDMAAAKTLDLTILLEIDADLIIRQNAEAIDDGHRAAGHVQNLWNQVLSKT